MQAGAAGERKPFGGACRSWGKGRGQRAGQRDVGLLQRVQQRATEVIVLVWTGMELMLLLVAGMGLCFGFVLNTVLISPGGFRYC